MKRRLNCFEIKKFTPRTKWGMMRGLHRYISNRRTNSKLVWLMIKRHVYHVHFRRYIDGRATPHDVRVVSSYRIPITQFPTFWTIQQYSQWPRVAALVIILVTPPPLPQPAWSIATAQPAANKPAHPINPGHSSRLTISDGTSTPQNGG